MAYVDRDFDKAYTLQGKKARESPGSVGGMRGYRDWLQFQSLWYSRARSPLME